MFSKFTSKSLSKILASSKKLPQANRFEARPLQRISYSHEKYEEKTSASDDQPSRIELLKSKAASLKQSTRDFIQMFVSGSKSAYHDARYLYSVTFSKPKQERTVEEISEVSRIKINLKKFVPFYTSMIIPGGAAVMFLYLYLCPRGVPTYFMKEHDQIEKQRKQIVNQAKAHILLKDHLLTIMRQKGYQGTDDDAHSMLQFLNQNKKILLPKLKPSKMSLDMLRAANDFVMYDYIEGTYIINKIIRDAINLSPYCYTSIRRLTGAKDKTIWEHSYYDRSFNFETFPMSMIKKQFLKSQFKKKLNELKAEDSALLMGSYGDLKDSTAIMLAKERGFDTTDGNEARKWLMQSWKAIIQYNESNQVLSFWESVVLYSPHSN